MKSILLALSLTTALTLPDLAVARPVTITAQLNSRGWGAYVALYITDARGRYKQSLWMSGYRTGYYRHLRGWFRATRGNLGEIRGITGASIGGNRTLKVTVDLSNAMIDAGYKLHLDAAAENVGESPSDVVVPLTTKGAGKSYRGKAFVSNFSYRM